MDKIEAESSSSQNENECKEFVIISFPTNLEPVLFDQCCIYKVPWNLRRLNKGVYTPQLISIGPLHHRKHQKLAEMEKQKLIYLREFLELTNKTCDDFVSVIDEEKIRHSYGEKSKLCREEYLKMVLLDAVFIIELFRRNFDMEKEKEKKEEEKEKELYQNDYMLKKRWLKNDIQQDLLLLENQLPYFVLNAIFKKAFPNNYQPQLTTHESSGETPFRTKNGITFHELTCKYFKNYIPGSTITVQKHEVLHFTDLLRYFMSKTHPTTNSRTKNICNATKLDGAGVEFIKENQNKCLTDINFDEAELKCCKGAKLMSCKGAKLKMPQFEVDDSTERVIRNLMALEQCHYPSEAFICNYIFLMDNLIDTAKDVEFLVGKGVVVNYLGSNEAVAKMINKLCINIIGSNSCYHDICEKLEKHTKKHRYRAIQTLMSVYFANIWRGTSTVAAIILLLLTLVQTVLALHQTISSLL